ncbi:MAG: hypothetical protein L0229_20230 [Blastocatellia bacterium]|nr:hypothetical protein [Blastocatellia bacterium]
MHMDLVAGDSGTTLVVTCKDKDSKAAINLNGKNVKVKWRANGGALQTKTMTVTDAAGGVAEYLFLTGELIKGILKGEVEITDSSGLVITQVEPFSLSIRSKI